MPKVILWISAILMMTSGVGVYAQAVPSLQDRSAIFSFCGVSRLFTEKEKTLTGKDSDAEIEIAVLLCEKYTQIDAKDCVEKEPALTEIIYKFKNKERAEYGLAQAFTELKKLLLQLEVENGCTTKPKPFQHPDPFGKR